MRAVQRRSRRALWKPSSPALSPAGLLTWWWRRRRPGCRVCLLEPLPPRETEATPRSTGLAAWRVVPVPVVLLPLPLPLRVHSQCPVQPLLFPAVVVFITLQIIMICWELFLPRESQFLTNRRSAFLASIPSLALSAVPGRWLVPRRCL